MILSKNSKLFGMIFVTSILFISLVIPQYLPLLFTARTGVFSTMPEAENYISTHQFYPDADNDDWYNPDYSGYHREHRTSWIARKLDVLGIKNNEWSPRAFYNLLTNLVNTREQQGYIGRFILARLAKKNEKFIIFGTLQGAFDSLVRDLKELKRLKIIDESFKIIDPTVSFIFNGDIINRSPYILETLTLVMQIMNINPGKVFYTRGESEDKQDWLDHGLKRELVLRAQGITKEDIPLERMITRFFNTLPLSIYLQAEKDDQITLLRISHYGIDNQEINEENFADFLATPHQEFTVHKIDSIQKQTEATPSIGAVIQHVARQFSYEPTQGLSIIGKNKGFIQWTIFSSPTPANRRTQLYFNDAFVALSIVDSIENWTLLLYKQDVREQTGFSTVGPLNLLTGLDAKDIQHAQDVNLKIVKFGSTVDLSKGVRIWGSRIKSALNMIFDNAHKKNLFGNFMVELILADDQYTPQNARTNILNFIHNFHIDTIVCPLGSSTLEAYLDIVKQKRIAVLFPITGATIFRDPTLENIINLRASYADEGRAITHYILENNKPTRVLLFYQDDSFGESCLAGGKEILQVAKDVTWVAIPYERNDVNFTAQIKKISEFNPDAIGFFSTSIASEGLIREIGVQELTDKKLFGISDMGEDRFKKFILDKGIQMTISNVVPNPRASELQTVIEYRNFSREYPQISLDPFSLEAYLGMVCLFNRLKEITWPITKEKIIASFEGINNLSLGGITYTFNPRTRELLNRVWIDTGDEKWIEVKLDEFHSQAS